MENLRELDRGELAMVGGSTQFEASGEPTRIGHTIERLTRLKDGDFVEAVSATLQDSFRRE